VGSECRTYGAFPDFLWTVAALANFMRLSLLKAARALLDGATYRKPGSHHLPSIPSPSGLGYVWTAGPPGLDELSGRIPFLLPDAAKSGKSQLKGPEFHRLDYAFADPTEVPSLVCRFRG
jgi:hypothetical protein